MTPPTHPFVETALSYALTYVSQYLPHHSIQPASISIIADNDYYSQPAKKATSASRFLDFGVPLRDAHKTGLGSSAALVTAFTAALLVHYLPQDAFDPSTQQGKRRLHNLAQAAHCAAQGKVGSGFDVASASSAPACTAASRPRCCNRTASPARLPSRSG